MLKILIIYTKQNTNKTQNAIQVVVLLSSLRSFGFYK